MRLKRRRLRSTRIRLLELAVAARHASSRLGLAAIRLRNAHARTGDRELLKMLERVLKAQAALDIVATRLEAMADLGAVMGFDVGIVRRVLAEVRASAASIYPGITSMLAELENAVAEIAALAGVDVDTGEVNQKIDEAVRKILEEAATVAAHRVSQIADSST